MISFAIELLVGGAGYFALKALDKAVLEPLATRAGRELLDRTVGPLTRELDQRLEEQGIDQDFEGIVRNWLGHEDLTEEQTERIVEEVFRRWDLRVAAMTCKQAQARPWRF